MQMQIDEQAKSFIKLSIDYRIFEKNGRQMEQVMHV